MAGMLCLFYIMESTEEHSLINSFPQHTNTSRPSYSVSPVWLQAAVSVSSVYILCYPALSIAWVLPTPIWQLFFLCRNVCFIVGVRLVTLLIMLGCPIRKTCWSHEPSEAIFRSNSPSKGIWVFWALGWFSVGFGSDLDHELDHEHTDSRHTPTVRGTASPQTGVKGNQVKLVFGISSLFPGQLIGSLMRNWIQ